MKKIYRRTRHSVSLLHAHLVFCTKYRRRVFSKRVFQSLKVSLQKTAKILDVEILEINVEGDHLHLMILYPPKFSLSILVKRFKGASSHSLRKRRFAEILKGLWGKAFWSPSFFIVSVGGATLEVLKRYIQNQAPKTELSLQNVHGDKNLHPETKMPLPRFGSPDSNPGF